MPSTGKMAMISTLGLGQHIYFMRMILAAALFFIVDVQAATVPNQRLTFDHLTTGFPLAGQHEFVACESCHVGGVFKGTPKTCNGCHNGVIARGKTANHIPTTAACDACHSVTVTFSENAVMNHSATTLPCATCHNDTLATGKNTGHLTTTLDCGKCHTTTTFATGKVSHDGYINDCARSGCHNGTDASGKAGKHNQGLGTTNECQLCHKTSPARWAPAFTFDHTQISPPTACANCHDGTGKLAKKGKGPTHIVTALPCDSCHTSSAWLPAGVDHSSIINNCISCHNGTQASGKSGKHSLGLNTSNQCEICHVKAPGRWVQITKFDHAQIQPPTACATCHDGSGRLAQKGKGPAHIPTPSTQACSDCHSVNAWKPTQFDHTPAQIGARICSDCHNGTSAQGMSATHIAVKPNVCGSCHKPNTNWKVASLGVDHTQTVGTCESCHNGTNAKTKSAKHIASSNDCLKCHKSTTSWQVANNAVDHTQVIPSAGGCINCHVRGNAVNVKTFKSATHPNTTNNCTACHAVAPTSWSNYKKPIDHKEVLGSCANIGCHSAPTIGMTKSSTHPATTNRCEVCHAIPPALWKDYKKPIDHKEILGSCVTCHVSGGISQGKGPTHPTTSNNCLACHAIPPAKWTPATKVDHKEVTGTCVSCHVSGNTVNVKTFKLPSHPSTTDACASCHATAPAKWKPILKMDHSQIIGVMNCVGCHNGTIAKGKSATHIATTNNCAACHTTTAWVPYRTVDHKEIPSVVCNGCHNGTIAQGKSSTHIAYTPATLQCSECHSTIAWSPTMFDHSKVNTTNCFGCHNGTNASGKGPTHIATTNLCSACHNPGTNWVPFAVNHDQVTGSCVSCHVSGNTKNVKTFKSPTHPNTTNNCVACHAKAPSKWSPALKVDHAEVLGSCANVGCHASTKPATHMPTTNRCEACHVVTAWSPVPSNKVDHLQVTGACSGCHVGGNRFGVKTFKSVNHIPSSALCDNCHDAPPSGLGWKVIIVDHAQVTGTCFSCHTNPNSYGVRTYRSASHIPTTTDCIKCHSSGPPGRWTPALRVDHTQFTGNPSCSSCHDGVKAKGKGTSHFVTTAQCNVCHTVNGWSPVNYTHTAGTRFVTHAFSTSNCSRCHTPAPGTSIAKKPYPYTLCASCHYDDYLREHSGPPGNKSDCRGSGCHNSMSGW